MSSKIAPNTRELIETHAIAKEAQGEGVDDKYALYYSDRVPPVKFRSTVGVSSIKKSRPLSPVAEEASFRGPVYKFNVENDLPYTCKENLE